MAPKVVKQLAGKRKAGGAASPDAKKKPQVTSGISVNWGKSKATNLKLGELEASQVLPLFKEIH